MECGASFRLIMFIITIHCTATINDISSYCTTPNVYENESGNITCHFSVDIRLHKPDVQVNVIKVGTRAPDNIVNYSWINGSEQHDIHVAPGYECDGNLTNTLTIKIPSATKQNHSGEYKCLVHGVDPNFTSCSLFVEEKSQGSNIGNHSSGINESLGTVCVVVIAILACLLIACLVFVILMCIERTRVCILSSYKKCPCRDRDHEPGRNDPGEGAPMNESHSR